MDVRNLTAQQLHAFLEPTERFSELLREIGEALEEMQFHGDDPLAWRIASATDEIERLKAVIQFFAKKEYQSERPVASRPMTLGEFARGRPHLCATYVFREDSKRCNRFVAIEQPHRMPLSPQTPGVLIDSNRWVGGVPGSADLWGAWIDGGVMVETAPERWTELRRQTPDGILSVRPEGVGNGT